MGWIYRMTAGSTPKPSNPYFNAGLQVWWSHTVIKLNSYPICQLSGWLRGGTSSILRQALLLTSTYQVVAGDLPCTQ